MLCLVLPLLSALAPTQADALPQTAVSGWDTANGQRMGYLPVLGAPPLRFESPPPRPEPAAPAVTLPNTPPSATENPAPPTMPVTPPAAEPSAAEPADTSPTATPAKQPPAMIPDDARPTIRAEDFLPYFQIPGSAQQPSDVTLLVPAARSAPTPAAIPPSSATYTQTPK
jgi:hypothetical protein